jgi:hypothetical protein
MNDENWPFDDPQNVAVFAVRSICEQGKPILYVYQDEYDGAMVLGSSIQIESRKRKKAR